jgi:hypothetical protein
MSMETSEHGELDHALRALREEQGTLEQARALEQRLLDKLGEKALMAPLAPAGTHSGRLALLGGMTVLIGLLALIGRPQPAPPPPTEPRQGVEAPIASAAPAPAFVPPMTISTPAPPQIETTVERPPCKPTRDERASRGTRRKAAPPVVLPPREGELSMLHRARAALRHSPDAALSITEQHAHDYPAGVFVEEREVLAIEALLKKRRTAEALDRAERFVAERTSSTYALQLREMLLTKPRLVSAALTSERRRPAP